MDQFDSCSSIVRRTRLDILESAWTTILRSILEGVCCMDASDITEESATSHRSVRIKPSSDPPQPAPYAPLTTSATRHNDTLTPHPFLTNEDLWTKVLSFLTRQQACVAARCCCVVNQARLNNQDKQSFQPRVLVCCSGNSQLVEVNIESGESKAYVCGTRRGTVPKYGWNTSLAVSPYDNCVYVCQYHCSGLTRFSGGKLKSLGVLASGPCIKAPEGVAFARNRVYVASIENATIVGFSLEGHHLQDLPLDPRLHAAWGMTSGPDNALYVACHETYFAKLPADYTHPPALANGSILRIALDETGVMIGFSEFNSVQDRAALRRPSGLCFGPNGNLFVTSMDKCILEFSGPRGVGMGRLVRVFADLTQQPGLPWDVLWVRGKVLVTVHEGVSSKEEGREGRVLVLDEDGQVVKTIFSEHFWHPNMMCVQ